MLETAKLMAFVATADPERSRTFYQETLGLRFVADEPFALVFDSNGTMLRIQKVEKSEPLPFTALGWQVADIRSALADLSRRGVICERYSFLEQDDAGVWITPSQARVAWFKDPDGNLLSLTQFR